MHEQPHTDWKLLAGILASVVIHVGAAAMFASGVSLTGDDLSEPAPPEFEEPEIRPGINESRATTISWLGYEEPTPHEAQEANVDQPALARGPAPNPAIEQSGVPALPPPAPKPKPLAEAADLARLPTIPLPDQSLDELLAQLEATAPEATTAKKPPAQPVPEQRPTKPNELPDTTEAEQPSEAGGGPSESPATSRTKPTEIRPGEPVAMEGIEIETRRPKFTTVTRLTAAPQNPTVLVRFDANGKVVLADIIESSGYRNVDRPVLDAMYGWRAKGKKIDELRQKDGASTFELTFRIVLR